MATNPMTNERIASPGSIHRQLRTLSVWRRTNQTVGPARSRTSRWLTLTVAAVLAVTTACAGDGPTAPGDPDGGGPGAPATPVGAYAISTVDAKSLPWTMYADTGYTLEVQGGTLSITTDAKWVAKTTTRETVAGFVSVYTDSTFGTWAISSGGKTAVLTNVESGSTSSVTWTSTAATVVQLDGATTHTIVYTKN